MGKARCGEPDAHCVEWLQAGARPMLLPRSLAHLKREISEKKWGEARCWAASRVTTKKYRLPREQRPDKTEAGSSKMLASRFYQLKTGHCLTGQYLEWTGNQPTAKCWWCPYRTQMRDHVFKNCPRWKPQQKMQWAEVREGSKSGRSQFKIRDFLADERCSQGNRLPLHYGCGKAGPG